MIDIPTSGVHGLLFRYHEDKGYCWKRDDEDAEDEDGDNDDDDEEDDEDVDDDDYDDDHDGDDDDNDDDGDCVDLANEPSTILDTAKKHTWNNGWYCFLVDKNTVKLEGKKCKKAKHPYICQKGR